MGLRKSKQLYEFVMSPNLPTQLVYSMTGMGFPKANVGIQLVERIRMYSDDL